MAGVREIRQCILLEYHSKCLTPSFSILELKCMFVNLNVVCL